jgi:hypothetical protein
MYEFVKRGDPPVVGITKLNGITLEELKKPCRQVPLGIEADSSTAESLPTTTSKSL